MGRKRKSREQELQDWKNQQLIKEMEAGSVDDEAALVREGATGRKDRIDALYGGEGEPDGSGHGHLVSNDGLNASYLRDPGQDKDDYIVDERQDDPYR